MNRSGAQDRARDTTPAGWSTALRITAATLTDTMRKPPRNTTAWPYCHCDHAQAHTPTPTIPAPDSTGRLRAEDASMRRAATPQRDAGGQGRPHEETLGVGVGAEVDPGGIRGRVEQQGHLERRGQGPHHRHRQQGLQARAEPLRRNRMMARTTSGHTM